MIERIGTQDVFVRNYTSNFDVKEYIQSILMPMAFPNIPMNKLNLGLTGITSELISHAIEDAFSTASLMLNESFITRSVLPNSIYSQASLFNMGYTFATPSRCQFVVQIWLEDIIKYSTKVRNTLTYRYVLDKNTKLILGDNTYRFDYDVIIDHQYIEGRRSYNIYYDINEENSIAITRTKYIRHQVTNIGWLVLFPELQEFDRKIEMNTISDNLITVNSDIILRWFRQISGMDLIYITPRGERLPMKKKIQHTKEEQDPFCWYAFTNENTIRLMFSNKRGYFQPAFNSKIESTIYVSRGADANFDNYDSKAPVPVQRTGERFEYNASTRVVGLCYGASTGGTNRGDIELLRDDVITTYNTVKVLSTDNDLRMWFNNFAKRYNTKAFFFKRRDDPTGKMFSQFVAIIDNTYIYPTNTLNINVEQNQFDFVNSSANGINREFIIRPGHLWEYADRELTDDDLQKIIERPSPTNNYISDIDELKEYIKDGNKIMYGTHRVIYKNDTFNIEPRDTVRMITGSNGMAFIMDESLPIMDDKRQFMFVNPFYIKLNRRPTISANYNCLINHTSYPEEIPIDTNTFYQFQLATLSINRSLSKEDDNRYHIEVVCVPAVGQESIDYIKHINESDKLEENDLRLILITNTRLYGETGYIEMIPVERRIGGSFRFAIDISVNDNLDSNMMLEVDLDKTPMTSRIFNGPKMGTVQIDSNETSFHFIAIYKDMRIVSTADILNNPSFNGYIIANRFCNAHRDLTLYKPMTMMRNVITFAGYNDNYNVTADLVPFLKYDVPLDEAKMAYFIRAYGEQYAAVEPVLKRLDGNSFLDFKLYNTYGRSNNYYIGPPDDSPVLWDSDTLLDNVHVHIRFRMAVYDRSTYTQTVEAVIDEIQHFFESLDAGDIRDIHVSDLIHIIKDNHPNVNYVRFLGFNNYDANKQSIFVKYDDIAELREEQLRPYVPEMVRVDRSSITITEEV